MDGFGQLWKGSGGETGIRTQVRVSPKHAFQACAFSHSAISPKLKSFARRIIAREASGYHEDSVGASVCQQEPPHEPGLPPQELLRPEPPHVRCCSMNRARRSRCVRKAMRWVNQVVFPAPVMPEKDADWLSHQVAATTAQLRSSAFPSSAALQEERRWWFPYALRRHQASNSWAHKHTQWCSDYSSRSQTGYT